jgi:hypothetical protein
MADDVSASFPGIQKAWSEVVNAGLLLNPQCEENDQQVTGHYRRWCWGRVTKASHSLVPPLPVQSTDYRLNEL